MKDIVTLQVKYVGICGSDLQKLVPATQESFKKLGHEIVADYKGTQVVVNPMMGCGNCAHCLGGRARYCRNLKALGRNIPGGFSGNVKVQRQNIIPITLPLPEIGVLCDPYAVVIHGLSSRVDVETATIFGDGIIAQLCLLYLYLNRKTLKKIRVVVKEQRRIAAFDKVYAPLFEEIGADWICRDIDSLDTAEASAQLIVETVGRRQDSTLGGAISSVTPGGTVLVFGVYPEGYMAHLKVRELFYKEAELVGVNSYEPDEFTEAVRQIERNFSVFVPLLGKTYRAADWKEALSAAGKHADGRPKKIVVSFG